MRKGFKTFLSLSRHYNVRGMVFVTGETASLVADLLRDAVELGFEIGSHSMHHRSVVDMTISEFKEDLRASLNAIEEACGVRPRAFRAPSFSLPANNEYLTALRSERIEIDSSYAVGPHASGCGVSEEQFSKLVSENESLRLIPVRGLGPGGTVFPGGGYFRAAPGRSFTNVVGSTKSRRLQVLYFHPRDFLPLYLPRNTLQFSKFLKSSIALGSPQRKFQFLARTHEFLSTEQALTLDI